VRRLLSLVLLAVFGLPLILPALALAQGPNSNLPMCCRRNGVHHCAMAMRSRAADSPGTRLSSIPQHCPAYPALVTPLRHVDLAGPAASADVAESVSQTAVLQRAAAFTPLALDFGRHKRGPPSPLL
jgi:hypothetical protein